MKNRFRLLILTSLSLFLTSGFYYMTYIFNPAFNNQRNVVYIRNFREQGGSFRIILLLVLLIVFSIMFFVYAKEDSEQLELYGQSGTPELYKKNNIFSITRLFQYYTIIVAFLLLIRDGKRSISLGAEMMSYYIFKTDILFVMWDPIFIQFLVFTITLLLEYIKNLKTIE